MPGRGDQVSAVRRAWPSVVAGAVAVFLLVRMAWQAGGYFAPSYLWAGAVAFAVIAGLLVLHVPRYRLSTHALVGLGALSGLAAWTGFSATWSTWPDGALLDFQRDLLYVALFALGLLASGSGRYARHVVWGVLGVVVVIVGAGLLSRIYPDVVRGTPDVAHLTGYRLSYPLSYWNAYAALAALGTVLALGLAADPRTHFVLRAVAAGASVVLAVALYMSFSRGGWLALIIGLVVLVLLGAHHGSLLLTAAIVGGAVVLAIARLRSYPALIEDPTAGSGQLSQGHAYGPQLVLLVGATVAIQGLVGAGRASPQLMQALRPVVRPLLLTLAAVGVLAAGVGYIVKTRAVEGNAAAALRDTNDWLDRQWQDFLAPTRFTESGSARLTTTKGNRSDLYRVAFDGFEAHPLRGDGSGSFQYRWVRNREIPQDVKDVHSLEFETLGELGAPGALLLLAFLASLVVATVRSRTLPGGLARSQTAAVGAACAVCVAHAWVDWDWQMPAVTGVFLVLSTSLYPYGRVRRRRRTQSLSTSP